MARFALTLEGLEGAPLRLIYDTGASTLCHEDGTRVSLAAIDRDYHAGYEYPPIHAVSPQAPGRKHRRPLRLKIQLGLGCNYSCSYCSQAAHKHEAEATSSRDVDAFLEQLDRHLEAAPERVELWGGEPLLYWKKIVGLVPALRARWGAVRIGMVTNGVLLDDEKVDFIKAQDLRVTLSHDGPGQRLRGPDPFDDPQWLRVVQRLHDEHGVWFNMVMSKANLDPAAAIAWISQRLGRPARVNKEGVVNAHDAALALTAADRARLSATVFVQTVTGALDAVPYVRNKLTNFFASLVYAAPAERMGQKCQMDREDHLAVDLAGNVLTCQNTGASGAHRIGALAALDEARLDTSWHWSHRPGCVACPVLHLCGGACMFLQGAAWEATCANEYAYNLGMLNAALYFITGKALVAIEALDAPVEVVTRKRIIPLKELRPC